MKQTHSKSDYITHSLFSINETVHRPNKKHAPKRIFPSMYRRRQTPFFDYSISQHAHFKVKWGSVVFFDFIFLVSPPVGNALNNTPMSALWWIFIRWWYVYMLYVHVNSITCVWWWWWPHTQCMQWWWALPAVLYFRGHGHVLAHGQVQLYEGIYSNHKPLNHNIAHIVLSYYCSYISATIIICVFVGFVGFGWGTKRGAFVCVVGLAIERP